MDNRYQETFDTWNSVAALYQDKFMHLDLYNASYDFACNSLTQAKPKVLEIGCGPGNITQYLLSQKPELNIFAIDIAPNMITLAQQNNPTATFAVMDARDISQIQEKFDAIICGFCLPYLSSTDSIRLMADCGHLLNNSGLLYISFIAGDPDKSGFQIAGSGQRTYCYFHTLSNLTSLLYQNNFDILKVFNVAYPKSTTETETHTIITAIRKTVS